MNDDELFDNSNFDSSLDNDINATDYMNSNDYRNAETPLTVQQKNAENFVDNFIKTEIPLEKSDEGMAGPRPFNGDTSTLNSWHYDYETDTAYDLDDPVNREYFDNNTNPNNSLGGGSNSDDSNGVGGLGGNDNGMPYDDNHYRPTTTTTDFSMQETNINVSKNNPDSESFKAQAEQAATEIIYQNMSRVTEEADDGLTEYQRQVNRLSQAMGALTHASNDAFVDRCYDNAFGNVNNLSEETKQVLGISDNEQRKFDAFSNSVQIGVPELNSKGETVNNWSGLNVGGGCNNWTNDAANIRFCVVDTKNPMAGCQYITKEQFNSNPSAYSSFNIATPGVNNMGVDKGISLQSIANADPKTLMSAANKEKSLADNFYNKNKTSNDKFEVLSQCRDTLEKNLRNTDPKFDKIVSSGNYSAKKAEIREYMKSLDLSNPQNRVLYEQAQLLSNSEKAVATKGSSFIGSINGRVNTLESLTGMKGNDLIRGKDFVTGVVSNTHKVVNQLQRTQISLLTKGTGFTNLATKKLDKIANSKGLVGKAVNKASNGKINDLADKASQKLKDSAMSRRAKGEEIIKNKQLRKTSDGRFEIKNKRIESRYTKTIDRANKRAEKLAGKQRKIDEKLKNSKFDKWDSKGTKAKLEAKRDRLQKRSDKNSKFADKLTKKKENRLKRRNDKREKWKNSFLGKAFALPGKAFHSLKVGLENTAIGKLFKMFHNGINAVELAVDAVKRWFKKWFIGIPTVVFAGVMIALVLALNLCLFLDSFLSGIYMEPDLVSNINYNQYIVDKTCYVMGNSFTKAAARDAWLYYLFHPENNYSQDGEKGYYWYNSLAIADNPYEHIWYREQCDNTSQTDTGELIYGDMYVQNPDDRIDVPNININMVPILSLANYRFDGEINFDTYLPVMAYCYTLYARSHDLAQFDSNSGGPTTHYLVEGNEKNGNAEYGRTVYNSCYHLTRASDCYDIGVTTTATRIDGVANPSWSSSGKCDNVFYHGANPVVDNIPIIGSLLNAGQSVATDIGNWINNHNPFSSGDGLALHQGTELSYYNSTTGTRNFSGNTQNYSTYLGNSGYYHTVNVNGNACVYSTGSAFTYGNWENGAISNYYIGCDNIKYYQWSTDENDYFVGTNICPYSHPIKDGSVCIGSGNDYVWTACTCGYMEHPYHTGECCSIPERPAEYEEGYTEHIVSGPYGPPNAQFYVESNIYHPGACIDPGHHHGDGTCNHDACPYGYTHTHTPWTSATNPGCWVTLAVCGGHCGGHSVGTVDVAIINSWKGLMQLDDIGSFRAISSGDFNTVFNISNLALSVRIWHWYWDTKTQLWAWGIPTISGTIGYIYDFGIASVNALYSEVASWWNNIWSNVAEGDYANAVLGVFGLSYGEDANGEDFANNLEDGGFDKNQSLENTSDDLFYHSGFATQFTGWFPGQQNFYIYDELLNAWIYDFENADTSSYAIDTLHVDPAVALDLYSLYGDDGTLFDDQVTYQITFDPVTHYPSSVPVHTNNSSNITNIDGNWEDALGSWYSSADLWHVEFPVGSEKFPYDRNPSGSIFSYKLGDTDYNKDWNTVVGDDDDN